MPESLASLRKAKKITQEQLGVLAAQHLGRSIGAGYAQKKIARFEAGAAAPTPEELRAIANVLGVNEETIAIATESRAANEAVSVIDQLTTNSTGARCLMAICMLGRPRPEPLDATYTTAKEAVDSGSLSIAVFIPYPSTIYSEEPSDEISHLQGTYVNIRRSVDEANFNFIKALKGKGGSVALYLPKSGLTKSSATVIPPVVRQQYSLTIRQAVPDGPITKVLHAWTPSSDTDTARQVTATGIYSVSDQLYLWESYFGRIIPHWIDNDNFLVSDHYWEKRIR